MSACARALDSSRIMRAPFYHRITEGIRITARPRFLREEPPSERVQFVFAYHIRIENTGTQSVRLLRRRWLIHDDLAGDSVVEGDGVVGQQPYLAVGGVHEYESFCILKGPMGWMEGSYYFQRDNGGELEVAIPRFDLVAPT